MLGLVQKMIIAFDCQTALAVKLNMVYMLVEVYTSIFAVTRHVELFTRLSLRILIRLT